MVKKQKDPKMITGITAEWVVGFTDGEGCFTRCDKGTVIWNGREYQRRYYPRFDIGQSEKEILNEIQKFWGFGWVQRGHHPRGNEKQAWSYTCSGFRQCLKTKQFFEAHPLCSVTKRRQFAQWKATFFPNGDTIPIQGRTNKSARRI